MINFYDIKIKTFCALFFSFPLFLVNAQHNTVETWWTETIRLYEQTSQIQPSRTVTEVIELDAQGRIKSSEITETRYERIGSEERVIVLRNGVDVSADRRNQRQRNNNSSEGFGAMPFDARYAPLTVRTSISTLNNITLVSYTISTQAGPVEGIAHFSENGHLTYIEQVWLKPSGAVSAMRAECYFDYQNGIPIITRINFEGSASVLFIKRHFRMNIENFDWTRKP